MLEVAPDVWSLALAPRHALNVFLVGDVLVDAGWPRHARKVLAALKDHPVRAHAITHAHIDHVGASRAVVDALRVPMWAPAGDAEAVEAGAAVVADTWLRPLARRVAKFPPVPVTRRLREGDDLAVGFTVLEVPGHSPGHIAFWRAEDGVLICGDVLSNIRMPTTRAGLCLPPPPVTPDPAGNRAAARRLAELQPRLALFAHGRPMRDPVRLRASVAALIG